MDREHFVACGVLAALFGIFVACGLAPGVTVPTTGVRLHDCPASWDPDAIAREVDALVARLPVDTLDERAAAGREIDRASVFCEHVPTMPLYLCGDTRVHGGCVVLSTDPISPHDVRLAVVDRHDGTVEDFCAAYLIVELAKVAGFGAGVGARVLERDDDVGRAWNAATRPCDPRPAHENDALWGAAEMPHPNP